MKELAFCYVIRFDLQIAAMLLKELLPVRYSSNGEGFFLMLFDSWRGSFDSVCQAFFCLRPM